MFIEEKGDRGWSAPGTFESGTWVVVCAPSLPTGSEPIREGPCPESVCASIHTLSMMGPFPTTMPQTQ